MDNLVTIKESFLIVLDSRNSIQLNKSWNSSVDFQFEDPINKEDGCILMSGSILNFSASNSIYNINETNNYLFFNTTRQNYKIYIPYGNYNFNTLQNTLYSIGIGSILISLNVNTNIITFTNTVDSYFFIDSTSTILPIIGGIIGTSYYNQQTILTLPYQCNFNGVNNINIYMSNLNTKNIDSLTKTNCSLIQSIQINPYSPQIVFNKTNDYSFTVSQRFFNSIQIDIKDDLNNYINFNNQPWNLTLCFSMIRDIQRFNYDDFQSIVNRNNFFNE